MAAVKSKDTRPEIIVRKHLWKHGFRYRTNDNRLPGKPDIVLARYKTVIFVHGCFWHAHTGCNHYTLPQTNTPFWEKKITRNIERDAEVREELKRMGWRTMVVWECQLKKEKLQTTLNEIVYLLSKSYLDDRRVKTYSIASNEEEQTMVAEDNEVYQIAKDLHA